MLSLELLQQQYELCLFRDACPWTEQGAFFNKRHA